MAEYESDNGYVCSPKESAAIDALCRLAKKWPASLGLYSMSGSLHVMPTDDTYRVLGEGLNQDGIIYTILGITNDGGDW